MMRKFYLIFYNIKKNTKKDEEASYINVENKTANNVYSQKNLLF